ncbi:MAG: hypothetical protein VB064_13760 [Oscillospiraceae bacterium]|nr:hypothetical protein [Oscillospiraceae bacterium]
MRSLLRRPSVNAVCISLFTAFYGLIFILTSGHGEFQDLLYYSRTSNGKASFLKSFSSFLAAGHQAYIAYALIAITIVVVVLLLIRRHPYDEYHISLLSGCLAVAVVLTMIAIAIFYLAILSESNGIVEKFTLFITIHWTVVVLADLSFVLLCRWR